MAVHDSRLNRLASQRDAYGCAFNREGDLFGLDGLRTELLSPDACVTELSAYYALPLNR